jgi:hypothetical protein
MSTNSKPEFEKPETLQHAMKAQGREVKVKPYHFLNPGAVWSLVSKATPSPLYLQDSAPYPLHEGRHTKQSHRLIIPDDVLIQFDLLMMSAVTLETCREMK